MWRILAIKFSVIKHRLTPLIVKGLSIFGISDTLNLAMMPSREICKDIGTTFTRRRVSTNNIRCQSRMPLFFLIFVLGFLLGISNKYVGYQILTPPPLIVPKYVIYSPQFCYNRSKSTEIAEGEQPRSNLSISKVPNSHHDYIVINCTY